MMLFYWKDRNLPGTIWFSADQAGIEESTSQTLAHKPPGNLIKTKILIQSSEAGS